MFSECKYFDPEKKNKVEEMNMDENIVPSDQNRQEKKNYLCPASKVGKHRFKNGVCKWC